MPQISKSGTDLGSQVIPKRLSSSSYKGESAQTALWFASAIHAHSSKGHHGPLAGKGCQIPGSPHTQDTWWWWLWFWLAVSRAVFASAALLSGSVGSGVLLFVIFVPHLSVDRFILLLWSVTTNSEDLGGQKNMNLLSHGSGGQRWEQAKSHWTEIEVWAGLCSFFGFSGRLPFFVLFSI